MTQNTNAAPGVGPFDGWATRRDDVQGPSKSGYYTVGIDAPGFWGHPITHYNAIEFHSKTLAVAEARRDLTLAAPDLLRALEGFIASTDMIGRSRFHYAAEYDRFCKIRSDAIAAVAAAKGTK